MLLRLRSSNLEMVMVSQVSMNRKGNVRAAIGQAVLPRYIFILANAEITEGSHSKIIAKV